MDPPSGDHRGQRGVVAWRSARLATLRTLYATKEPSDRVRLARLGARESVAPRRGRRAVLIGILRPQELVPDGRARQRERVSFQPDWLSRPLGVRPPVARAGGARTAVSAWRPDRRGPSTHGRHPVRAPSRRIPPA